MIDVSQGDQTIGRAVIFDMDGVITDSEPLYANALDFVLNREGHSLAAEDHRAVMRRSATYTWSYVFERLNLSGGIESWLAKYDKVVSDILATNAAANEGLSWLLLGLASRNIRVGLATGSRLKMIQIILDRLGVTDAFEAIATSDMVAAGKRAPDVYLLAARKLRVSPDQCLALDDSPHGLASAKAAGMTTIAVGPVPTDGMGSTNSDYAINRLTGFDFDWLDLVAKT